MSEWFDRERLLELLLDREHHQAELEELRRDPARAPELERLEHFLARSRQELGRDPAWSRWSRARETALVARILARTTGEDLSWRGELRLLTGFVRERLAASRGLRLVAASLLLHVLALPVLAVLMVPEAGPGFHIMIDLRPREPHDPLVEEPETASFEPDAATVSSAGPRRDRIENALRRARYVLSTRSGPDLGATEAGLEIELLAARSRALTERRWADWLENEERLEQASPLGRVLWTEVLLDRYALAGERSPLLGRLLNRLAQRERTLVPEDFDDLMRAGLNRARAYGLWEAPAGFDPRSIPDPLAPRWFEDLARAVAGTRLARDPAFARWMRWGRR